MKKLLVLFLAIFVMLNMAYANTTRNPQGTIKRINLLLDNLGETRDKIADNNRKIEALLFKNWILHAEFEKDMATLLPIFRETMDAYGTLAKIVSDLKVEVFDPSMFCFSDIERTLDKAGTKFTEAYNSVRRGKPGLAKARKAFHNSKANFMDMAPFIDKLIAQFQQTIGQPAPEPQPQPQPTPQPQPAVIKVEIRRQHINPANFIIINENTEAGQYVMAKAKVLMKENMSTLERIQLKFALAGANGFNYAIVKVSDDHYILFWWHVFDEVLDVLPID